MQMSTNAANVVLSIGQPPVADAGGPYTTSAGDWTRFSGVHSSDDAAVAQYVWSFGDGGTGSGATPLHRYAAIGDYPVSLVVYDNAGQASAPATTTVHVVAQALPVADAGGPYTGAAGGPPVYFDGSRSRDASGSADGIIKYIWDVNVAVDSDGNGTPDDDMDRVGAHPFYTYGAAGVYTAKLTVVDGSDQSNSTYVVVNIVPNLAPDVICVPYHGNTNAYHPAYAGSPVTLKGIVRDAGSLWYSWDFGDGSGTTAVQMVSNPYVLETSHAYNGGIGKTFIARLTVWDSTGLSGTDQYRVMLLASNTETRAAIAVDEGLWWLHKDQSKTTGAWPSSAAAGATASAIQAYEINGHLINGLPSQDPYVEDIDLGFRYLFTLLRVNAIGTERASALPVPAAQAKPTPSLGMSWLQAGIVPPMPAGARTVDANLKVRSQFVNAASNGLAIDVAVSYPPYELGMVMDAFAASQSRTFLALTGAANVKGRMFYDLLQDMVDMYAWGQELPGSAGRGGWRYNWHYGSADNSVSQWGAIGMRAAEDNFGITCPDIVKQENRIWLNTSWRGYDFGYDGSGPHVWGTTINTTPSALVQMSMDGFTITNPVWSTTENYIASTWASTYGDPNNRNYYGRYALTKALRLARPSKVDVFQNGFRWYEDDTMGIRRIVTDQQYAGGYWDGTYYNGDLGNELSTAWAIVMLTPSLFSQPPKAIMTAPQVWGYNTQLLFTAENSFTVDPAKHITQYMWDFNNDGNYDLITTNATDPRAVWTWYDVNYGGTDAPPTVVTVHLKVLDSDDPPQSDETFQTIIIAEPPHAPYAVPTVPPSASSGVPIRLSAARSYDIDPTDFITQYQWDFNNDDIPDLITSTPYITKVFNTTGVQTIGLRVVDDGVLNNGTPKTSVWSYVQIQIGMNQAPVANPGGP